MARTNEGKSSSRREVGTFSFRLFKGTCRVEEPLNHARNTDDWRQLREGEDFTVHKIGEGDAPYTDIIHYAIRFVRPVSMPPLVIKNRHSSSSTPHQESRSFMGLSVEYTWRGVTYFHAETAICPPLPADAQKIVRASEKDPSSFLPVGIERLFSGLRHASRANDEQRSDYGRGCVSPTNPYIPFFLAHKLSEPTGRWVVEGEPILAPKPPNGSTPSGHHYSFLVFPHCSVELDESGDKWVAIYFTVENHNISHNLDPVIGRLGCGMDTLLGQLFPGRFHELPWMHPAVGFGEPMDHSLTSDRTKQRTPPWYLIFRREKHGASSLSGLLNFFPKKGPPVVKEPRLKKNGEPYAVRKKKDVPPTSDVDVVAGGWTDDMSAARIDGGNEFHSRVLWEDKDSNEKMRAGRIAEPFIVAQLLRGIERIQVFEVGWLDCPGIPGFGASPDGLLFDPGATIHAVPSIVYNDWKRMCTGEPELCEGTHHKLKLKLNEKWTQLVGNGNPDYIIDLSNVVLEIKYSATTDRLSHWYIPQLYMEMICTGRWCIWLVKYAKPCLDRKTGKPTTPHHALIVYTLYRCPSFELALRNLCTMIAAKETGTPAFEEAAKEYRTKCHKLAFAVSQEASRRVITCDADLTCLMNEYGQALQWSDRSVFWGPAQPRSPYVLQCPRRKPVMVVDNDGEL